MIRYCFHVLDFFLGLACSFRVNGTPQRKASLESDYLILIKFHSIDEPANLCAVCVGGNVNSKTTYFFPIVRLILI
jgi:hypothetical protein